MTAIDLTAGSLAELCGRARPELACLGELAAPLVAAVGVVEHVGAGRGVDALGEPTFALDVLAAAGPDTDPAVVGRVLDFLRARLATPVSGAAVVGVAGAARRPVTLAEAVERYESTGLMMLSASTQLNYGLWLKRLVGVHGAEDPSLVTAGDLKDLIAGHVLGSANAVAPGAAPRRWASRRSGPSGPTWETSAGRPRTSPCGSASPPDATHRGGGGARRKPPWHGISPEA